MTRAGVSCRGVGVRFVFDRQRRPVTPMVARVRLGCTSWWGLRELDLELRGGESLGLVGANGAGKSTLLRALAGVLAADAGRIETRGRVGSVLSVSAGLSPLLTGRENATLLAVLAGLSRRAAKAALAEVERRSELGPAFEREVASYSQGMRARLAFASLETARPEILLLDEVHEAFDAEFRERLEHFVAEVLSGDGVVVAAGHDHRALGRLCEQGLWLHRGRRQSIGPFDEVVAAYAEGPRDDPVAVR